VTTEHRRACGTITRPTLTVREMSGNRATHPTADDAPPAVFEAAVATLQAVRPRTELTLAPVRAPQRLAPWTYALAAELTDVDDGPGATGRLVLLHDPAGHEAWDGVLRLVSYVRAELDGGLAGDPMLPEVGWSWLTEALETAGARYTALGGTVTQTSSARFGDIAGPPHSHDIELRASWTPMDADLRAHTEAFCMLLATAAGLPPVGVAAFER
jgi:Protein of unknown function (DUF3000)